MEVEIRPDLIPGIAEALQALHGRYKTCIVSDAIVSPGRCLKRLLESYDLARHFDGFVFSDIVGHSKPHRAMFEDAARQMGVALAEIVHIGDRDHNDVKGPQKLGMKAILFTATRAGRQGPHHRRRHLRPPRRSAGHRRSAGGGLTARPRPGMRGPSLAALRHRDFALY